MAANPDQYRLSELENQAVFEQEIKPWIFAHAKPAQQPVAIIFGGQPGAGKSALVEAAMSELEPSGGAAEIIGDDLREFHPLNEWLMQRDDKTAAIYTQRDISSWIEKAITEAKAQRFHIVIEGTMRDGNGVASTMQSLRSAGYFIDARALAVPWRLSELGILQRYEKQKATRGTGRMTPPEAHRAGYDGMLVTLERIERDLLADRVTVYRRGNVAIYSNELRGSQWVHEPQARAMVEAERARSMTAQECRDYAQSLDRLAAMLAQPERQASADEVRQVDELRQQARAEVKCGRGLER